MNALQTLEKEGHLVRIQEEVDPKLEMAAIHLRVFEAGGPANNLKELKGVNLKLFQIFLVQWIGAGMSLEIPLKK